jgi:hypothetical protein
VPIALDERKFGEGPVASERYADNGCCGRRGRKGSLGRSTIPLPSKSGPRAGVDERTPIS